MKFFNQVSLPLFFLFLIANSSCNTTNTKDTSVVEKPSQVSEPNLDKATVVSYENLNPSQFKEAISTDNNSIVLDVRTPEEIALGKIENATELNFYDKDFADKIMALDKDKSYYIYCKGGGRSAKAARLMIKNDFSKVYNLEGGYTAWSK